MKKIILSAIAILAITGTVMAQQPEQQPQQPQPAVGAGAPQGQPQAGPQAGGPQQQPQAGREENRAQQLAQRLMLDETTTAKFTSLYDEYQKALDEAGPARNKKGGKKGDKAQQPNAEQPQEQAAPTDAEIIEQIEAGLAAQKARIDVQLAYVDKFKAILTARQLQQLFEQGHRRGGQQGQPQPGSGQQGGQQGAPQGGQQGQGQPGAGPQGAPQGAPQGGQPGAAPQEAPQGN